MSMQPLCFDSLRLNLIQKQMDQQNELLRLIVKTMDIKTEYKDNDTDTFDKLDDLKSRKNIWGTNITNVRLRNIVLQRVMDSKNHIDNND
jgi:hypothetical protein